MRTLVDLALAPEHRRGHGALYGGLNQGRIDVARLRRALGSMPLPRAADGRIVLAADVSPWLRPDANTCPDRAFCHTFGRGEGKHQMVPGWPYSIAAALETGRTSWTAVLDAVRLEPGADVAAVTTVQLREVVERLVAVGQWKPGAPEVLVVLDAGYDAPRIAHLLGDLPVEILGRLRSDRVMRRPTPPRVYDPKGGRPPKHGGEFVFGDPTTWGTEQAMTVTDTRLCFGEGEPFVRRSRSTVSSPCRGRRRADGPAPGTRPHAAGGLVGLLRDDCLDVAFAQVGDLMRA